MCTRQLRRRSTAKRSAAPDKDKKQVNMVRRALSFNRKPRRRGADGGEFTALLEGSAEDREARLLARRLAAAKPEFYNFENRFKSPNSIGSR